MEPRDVMTATAATRDIGAAFYFVPETVGVGKEHGLGGFRFYLVGRGGVLGNVDADVVRSAFGYFQPDLVRKLWESSTEIKPARDAARLYNECAHDFGRRTFSDIDPDVLSGFNAAAAKLIDGHEGASMPLFVAHRAEPRPAEAPALAMHLAMVLRELRGSVHLLALAAVGLDTSVAHAIRRPDDVGTFGWDPAPEATDADRELWQRAEDLTDDLLAPLYATLTDAEAAALIEGTDALATAIG